MTFSEKTRKRIRCLTILGAVLVIPFILQALVVGYSIAMGDITWQHFANEVLPKQPRFGGVVIFALIGLSALINAYVLRKRNKRFL